MTNTFNDTMTDIALALLDATAAAERGDEETLAETLVDAEVAFQQLPDAEREPLTEQFNRLRRLIMNS